MLELKGLSGGLARGTKDSPANRRAGPDQPARRLPGVELIFRRRQFAPEAGGVAAQSGGYFSPVSRCSYWEVTASQE
jgi:hypothetical protein